MKRLVEPPLFCLITDGTTRPPTYQTQKPALIETIRDAVSGGVNVIQLREKLLPGRLLFELARDVVTELAETNALVMVNDRADIAVAAGAAGVHLRESSMSPDIVRRDFPNLVIGVSTHSTGAALAAASGGADFVVYGPVFETPGKSSPTGTEELARVIREVPHLPVIAIGGIESSNVERVLSSGAVGVAAIRALYDPDERKQIVRLVSAHYSRLR